MPDAVGVGVLVGVVELAADEVDVGFERLTFPVGRVRVAEVDELEVEAVVLKDEVVVLEVEVVMLVVLEDDVAGLVRRAFFSARSIRLLAAHVQLSMYDTISKGADVP